MLTVKCIQKFRNKQNQIYGYRLQDINGQTQDVQPNNLKQAIKNGQIHVVNLTLTKDDRLIDTTEHQLQSKKLGSSPQLPKSEIIKQRLVDAAEYVWLNQASFLDVKYYDFFDNPASTLSTTDNFDIIIDGVKYIGHIEMHIEQYKILFNLGIQKSEDDGARYLESKSVKIDIFKNTNDDINNAVAKYQEYLKNKYNCF